MGIPASCTSSQQTFTTESLHPAFAGWLLPIAPSAEPLGTRRPSPVRVVHASAVNMYAWLLEPPRRIVSFVNQTAANSDSINTGCKTEEGSVVQAGFAWSTLLFFWLCRWIFLYLPKLKHSEQTGKSPGRPWSLCDVTYFCHRFN